MRSTVKRGPRTRLLQKTQIRAQSRATMNAAFASLDRLLAGMNAPVLRAVRATAPMRPEDLVAASCIRKS